VAGVRELLNQVWATFRRVGIADDLQIVEEIAVLLSGQQLGDVHQIASWRPRSTVNVEAVRRPLEEAGSLLNGGMAELFNNHVLFRLPSMLPGGRYPTPRHVIALMHAIADIRANHSVADFACGSGGFLVHRAQSSLPTGQVFGCDISPEWTSLALSNCALHGLDNARVEPGSALTVFAAGGAFGTRTFDRILMNPSFGESVDPKEIIGALGERSSTRSETVLATLAVNRLADDGRACVLVPPGLLFGASAGEAGLRARLVRELQIEMVASLPSDTMQPFSSQQSNLLLIRNSDPDPEALTWFFRVERDGYPAGRSRDLTAPPQDVSDFPLLEAVLSAQSTTLLEQPTIRAELVRFQGDRPRAVIFTALNGATLSTVERFPSEQGPVLLARATRAEEEVLVGVEAATGLHEVVHDRQDYLRRSLKIRISNEAVSGVILHQDEDRARSVVVTADGYLLGVRIPQDGVSPPNYELSPLRYFAVEEDTGEAEPPATLLARIRRNQRTLLANIDSLLGHLDMAPVTSMPLPPPLWGDEHATLEPFKGLSPDQAAVWRRVRGKVQRDVAPGPELPVPFAPSDVESPPGSDPSAATLSALELFERMGLIVSVVIPLEGNQRLLRYRLASQRDRWPDQRPDSTEDMEAP